MSPFLRPFFIWNKFLCFHLLSYLHSPFGFQSLSHHLQLGQAAVMLVLPLHLQPDSLQSCEQVATDGPLLWGIVQTLLDQLDKIRVGMVDLILQYVNVLPTTLYFSSASNSLKIPGIKVCAREKGSRKLLKTNKMSDTPCQLLIEEILMQLNFCH